MKFWSLIILLLRVKTDIIILGNWYHWYHWLPANPFVQSKFVLVLLNSGTEGRGDGPIVFLGPPVSNIMLVQFIFFTFYFTLLFLVIYFYLLFFFFFFSSLTLFTCLFSFNSVIAERNTTHFGPRLLFLFLLPLLLLLTKYWKLCCTKSTHCFPSNGYLLIFSFFVFVISILIACIVAYFFSTLFSSFNYAIHVSTRWRYGFFSFVVLLVSFYRLE